MESNQFIENYKKLKSDIDNNNISDSAIIIINSQPFLTHQYIEHLSEQKHLAIQISESLDILKENNLFGLAQLREQYLKVVNINSLILDDAVKFIMHSKNAIIVAEKIDVKIDDFNPYIIKFPDIPDWGIQDFIASNINIEEKDRLWLASACKNDLFRIKNEIDKLRIFDSQSQPDLFKQFMKDKIFSDLSNYTIFDFMNAIVRKDISKIDQILRERANIDIEPLGVVTLIFNNFKNMLSIQSDPRCTAETLGISDKQFNVIRNQSKAYSFIDLKRIFEFICSMDNKIKNGMLDSTNKDQQIDYILVNIL